MSHSGNQRRAPLNFILKNRRKYSLIKHGERGMPYTYRPTLITHRLSMCRAQWRCCKPRENICEFAVEVTERDALGAAVLVCGRGARRRMEVRHDNEAHCVFMCLLELSGVSL